MVVLWNVRPGSHPYARISYYPYLTFRLSNIMIICHFKWLWLYRGVGCGCGVGVGLQKIPLWVTGENLSRPRNIRWHVLDLLFRQGTVWSWKADIFIHLFICRILWVNNERLCVSEWHEQFCMILSFGYFLRISHRSKTGFECCVCNCYAQ